MNNKNISITPVYKGNTFNVNKYIIQIVSNYLPVEVEKDVIFHPGSVAMVPFNKEGKVILVKQFRTPANRELFELPAGTLSPDESSLECANRELQEEIGFKANTFEYLGGFFTAPGYNSEYIDLYMATDLEESYLEADIDEVIEVCPFEIEDVLTMIDRGNIIDAKTIAGIFKALRHLKFENSNERH